LKESDYDTGVSVVGRPEPKAVPEVEAEAEPCGAKAKRRDGAYPTRPSGEQQENKLSDLFNDLC
jgi:hypothetical protein